MFFSFPPLLLLLNERELEFLEELGNALGLRHERRRPHQRRRAILVDSAGILLGRTAALRLHRRSGRFDETPVTSAGCTCVEHPGRDFPLAPPIAFRY